MNTEQLDELERVWSCDDQDNKGNCRNPHGCHCAEIASALSRLEQAEREKEEARDGESRWLLRVSAIREASGLGAGPMLSELPEEIGKLRSRLTESEARSQSLQEEVERLRRALEPFARAAEEFAGPFPERRYGPETGVNVKVTDCLIARTALTATDPKTGGEG